MAHLLYNRVLLSPFPIFPNIGIAMNMTTFPPFIQSIHIHKVRHLQNIDIQLDENKPKHLILTGPNGCGKTSLLLAIKEYLSEFKTPLYSLGVQFRRNIENKLNLIIFNIDEAVKEYKKGEFLICFFQAKRSATMQAVNGAQRLELPTSSAIDVNKESVGSRFLQFMVNQQNRAALLKLKGDEAGAREVQLWMEHITQQFRALFQDEALTLEYDIDQFDFTVHLSNREPFRLVENELSDGFAAALQVVVELLMRMEAVAPGQRNYNVPGIVLIDEIETHLHIKLQKAILPFLTAFFPRIQFIVTTHSPFVLTSLNEAVIFDLESHERWENMAPLSASTVVEEYFDLDLYSEAIKQQVRRLQALTAMPSRTAAETQELHDIYRQFEVIEFDRAPELVAQYHAIRAQAEGR